MNKTGKSVLIVSIAANAVLFACFATGYISINKSSAVGAQCKPKDGSVLLPEAAEATKALLAMDDMVELRDQLRALGLPNETVREIVTARIASRYTATLRDIGNAALETARQPYWRGDPSKGVDWYGYTLEQRAKLWETYNAQEQETRRLFGTDQTSSSALSYISDYAFLPFDKAARMGELQRDYSDLRARTIAEMAGFRMPGDEAKLKLLEEECKRDMEALLSPEERMENDLRNSRTAWELRRAFAGFGGTEEEYKAIFALQHALEEKYPSGTTYGASTFGGVDQSEFYRARAEAQKNIDAQIKDMLGDERYAEYVRGQRQDYQSLQAAAERFNLGAETVAQTYQVREVTAVEAKRISDDKNLDAGQKAEAYAALTEQATAQIRAALGNEVGDAYINNALPWLKNLPKGGNVTIDERGNVRVSQPRPAPPARGQGGG